MVYFQYGLQVEESGAVIMHIHVYCLVTSQISVEVLTKNETMSIHI